ncbi:MAG: 3-deoxy-manno-octulosonate-8-phosphatase KdsC [Gammaproteobacteria bacterium]|nr:3-deoxy-manno-octulosonate-8-phosphatase KdsC [Gammaproteobacteria bacterium]NVK87217.1 3-deoxy-manno-octulosonate-8-phosphatase KdsC [Gammaproteobacteria bacterium]
MDFNALPNDLRLKAQMIRLLIMDVDGVLSDGKVYYSNSGDELKNFNIKDGLGIKLLQQNNIKTAIITGRHSAIVERRAKELGIEFVFQGKSDKRAAFNELLQLCQVSANQVAHIGDDLPDLPLMQMAGLGIAVQDGNWFVKQHADWITTAGGGMGAVRETAELLLFSQQALESTYQQYLS